MSYKPLHGHKDLSPEYHNYMTFLKKVYRHEFRKNGFRRISTPIFEEKSFLEASGNYQNHILENTDFDIRQEASAGIMRAYLDQEFSERIQPLYLYFVDRFFKKLKSGFSESYYIGGEVIGEDDPIIDAILIHINYKVFNKIGLKGKFKIQINSTGIEKEKLKFEEDIINFYEGKRNSLSEASLQLLQTNPTAILRSTDEDDMILNENAPKMVGKYLKKQSKEHFNKFTEYLDILEIPYNIDNSIVATKTSQTKTIWEIKFDNGEVVSSGSRHNNLSLNIGQKKEIPASGFATNANILIKFLMEQDIRLINKDRTQLFFVQLGDDAKKIVLPLSIKAREAGINTRVSLGTPSMKEQMLKAQKSEAKYIIMVGIMEAKSGVFQVRNQEDGTQEEVKKEELIDYIIDKIGKENLNFYSPARDLVEKKS